jgi:hypothetical protein
MKTVSQPCLTCKALFNAPEREVKRGNGKYCSKECCKLGVAKNHKERYSQINQPNVECAYCQKPFYIKESRKSTSKSGLFFCSREHKDLAQRIEFGLVEIHPDHYNKGERNYRLIALRNLPNHCNRCGYERNISVLQVHHKDRNRSNSSIENLEILCANCHAEEHSAN